MNMKEIFTSKSGLFAIGAVVAAGCAGIWKWIKEGNEPIDTIYEVQSRRWSTSMQIYKKTLVKKSDWNAPNGAKILDTRWEFKEMKKVPSGVDANGDTTYKEVPEYATKYYYEIEEYVYNRTASASGTESYFGDTMTSPHYPEVELSSDETIHNKSAHYDAVFRNAETGEIKSFSLGSDVWRTIAPGNKVIITTTKWAPNSIKSIRTIA